MSEQSYDYDDDSSDEQQESQPNWRRKLEADAKAGREALARAEAAETAAKAAQRELAMRRVGIDPDTPMGAMFAKAHPDLVDVDTIKSEWEKVAPPAAPSADQAAMQRIAAAQSGGTSSGAYVPDFKAELNSIPLIVDGNYNPDYVNQVLAKTQEQAAREGRNFEVSGGHVTWQEGAAGPVPVVNEV
jgi:hypothetical protein